MLTVLFSGKESSFLNIGVTWAILSWAGNGSLACISLAILEIYLEITGAAALTAFGGIASTLVAFLGSSRFIHFLTCYSVTGEKSKADTFSFSLIFLMLGCSSLTGVSQSIPIFCAMLT